MCPLIGIRSVSDLERCITDIVKYLIYLYLLLNQLSVSVTVCIALCKHHLNEMLSPPVAELDNATMKWAVQQTSVGSNFQYDRNNHWIMPLRSGTYFMYINLTLTCTHTCESGVLTINVGKKLNCQVHLPVKTPAVNCWTVSRVDAMEKLLSQMTVPEKELKNWSLEMGFGMFLVD